MNAGALINIAGIARDLKEGVELSREAIEKGAALEKLQRWVMVQNREPERGLQRFEQVMKEAGLAC